MGAARFRGVAAQFCAVQYDSEPELWKFERYSTLAPETLTTLAHRSVSLANGLPNSTGESESRQAHV